MPLGRAWSVLEPLIEALRSDLIPADAIVPVGGVRRFEPLVEKLHILITHDDPEAVLDRVCALPVVDHVLDRTASDATVVIAHEDVTVTVVRAETAGAATIHHTGSPAHLRKLRSRAARRGLTLSEVSLTDKRARQLTCRSEHDVYERLGLAFIPPELREGGAELAAATRDGLPSMLRHADLRGDLHTHSRWSDGRDSIEAMARAARDLGYEYVAVTDHSPSSLASRSLRADDLTRQAAEVARVRERVDGITVLHGVEVDIMPDGRLDFPDEALEPLDIVLASLHHAAGQSGPELTERYLAAISHPYVSVITHLTNRLVGRRAGYDLDVDRLFEAAVETGTALEVDGAPVHLDMDGALARRAAAAGVMLTVDSDGHRTEALRRNMSFAIGTARRGWIEPRHVLNTRPVDEVRTFIQAKRASGARQTAARSQAGRLRR